MPVRNCPRCGLTNPEEAPRCDCGYDFAKATVEQPFVHQALPKELRTALVVLVILNLVVGGAALVGGDPVRILLTICWTVIIWFLYTWVVKKHYWAYIVLIVMTFPIGLVLADRRKVRLYCLQSHGAGMDGGSGPTTRKSSPWKKVGMGCSGVLAVVLVVFLALSELGTWMESQEPDVPAARSVVLTGADGEACAAKIADLAPDQIEAAMVPVLRDLSFVSLHIVPRINPEKLSAASKSTMLPADEAVFGLMDATVLGSAEKALLFAGRGIYFFNGSLSVDPNPGFVPYADLAKIEFRMKESNYIALTGNRVFDISGMKGKKRALPTLQHARVAIIDAAKCGE